MKSINGHDDSVCVDIFMRSDGSYGFEEYRRDTEDARGWFPIGHHSTLVFTSEAAAFTAACQEVVWLMP